MTTGSFRDRQSYSAKSDAARRDSQYEPQNRFYSEATNVTGTFSNQRFFAYK